MEVIEDDEGTSQTIKEEYYDTVFDVREVFSFTTIPDDNGEPAFIEIVTKNGVQCMLVYEDDVMIDLGRHFRNIDQP